MTEREQAQKAQTEDNAEPTAQPKIGVQAHHDHHVAKIGEVIDGIDEVLETNAEVFVRSYVQEGGQ